MSTPSERRLALDIMSLIRNAGRAPGASCRRLRADEGLRRWLYALGPADEPEWDDLRRHVRLESHRLRCDEITAVRLLLPTWRAQGMLLGAVRTAVRRLAEEGDGAPPDDSGTAAEQYDARGFGGGGGFGFGA